MKGKFLARSFTLELSLTEIDVLILALNWAVDKSVAKQGAQTKKLIALRDEILKLRRECVSELNNNEAKLKIKKDLDDYKDQASAEWEKVLFKEEEE